MLKSYCVSLFTSKAMNSLVGLRTQDAIQNGSTIALAYKLDTNLSLGDYTQVLVNVSALVIGTQGLLDGGVEDGKKTSDHGGGSVKVSGAPENLAETGGSAKPSGDGTGNLTKTSGSAKPSGDAKFVVNGESSMCGGSSSSAKFSHGIGNLAKTSGSNKSSGDTEFVVNGESSMCGGSSSSAKVSHGTGNLAKTSESAKLSGDAEFVVDGESSMCGGSSSSAKFSHGTGNLAKSSGSAKSSGDVEFVVNGESSMCGGSSSFAKVSHGTRNLAKTSGSTKTSSDAEFIESGKSNMANDLRWKAIHAVRARNGVLVLNHFRQLKKLGCGNSRSVYLLELSGTKCYFAVKVMEKPFPSRHKKLVRAVIERNLLQLLDHPFLPILYIHFETEESSCLVMEFCLEGD
ncbi:hypothetical protein Ancab_024918 [Ancistrocladus abbreviatus]